MNTDKLTDWKKAHGITIQPEQQEMFGKGAVGDAFELRPEIVPEGQEHPVTTDLDDSKPNGTQVLTALLFKKGE